MQQATIQWIGGDEFHATSPSGQQLIFDGATQSGPSPLETLLSALGACAAIDIVMILQKKRQALKSLSVTVEGDRREEYPRIYTALKVHFTVGGTVEPKAMEHALELASTKYCSVAGMLGKASSIVWDYTIEQG